MTTIAKPLERKVILVQSWTKAYDEEGWYPPLKDALEGLSADEADHKPSPGLHSIRELVNHILYYKERFLHRLKGEEYSPAYETNDETFTEMPPDYVNESWDDQVARMGNVHREIGKIIAELEESDLDRSAPDPIGAQILDLAFHDAYHTGQIILLRKMLERWKN